MSSSSSFLRRLLFGSLFLLLFLPHRLPFHRWLVSPHMLCCTSTCGTLRPPLLLPLNDSAFVVHSFCYFRCLSSSLHLEPKSLHLLHSCSHFRFFSFPSFYFRTLAIGTLFKR